MCLAIPGKINQINDNNLATIDILGVTREVSIDLTPKAKVGDFVLIHAGFAIEIVSEEFAQETIDLIKQFPELAADSMPSETSAISTTSIPDAPPKPTLAALFAEDNEDSE